MSNPVKHCKIELLAASPQDEGYGTMLSQALQICIIPMNVEYTEVMAATAALPFYENNKFILTGREEHGWLHTQEMRRERRRDFEMSLIHYRANPGK